MAARELPPLLAVATIAVRAASSLLEHGIVLLVLPGAQHAHARVPVGARDARSRPRPSSGDTARRRRRSLGPPRRELVPTVGRGMNPAFERHSRRSFWSPVPNPVSASRRRLGWSPEQFRRDSGAAAHVACQVGPSGSLPVGPPGPR